MKVICIKDASKIRDAWGRTPIEAGYVVPKVGEIYNVVRETICPCGCGTKVYYLEELPGGWESLFFRPVDESFGEDICSKIESEIEQKEKILMT